MSEVSQPETLYHLAAALALGLLIGTERGWQSRTQREGTRIAGLRTFGLLGLLGGVSALASQQLGAAWGAVALAAIALLLLTGYFLRWNAGQNASVTSSVAGLLTFSLGALAGIGEVVTAAAVAVVATILLGLKPVLHRWLRQIEPVELQAAMKLLLISVVLLPILPNRGFGPWDALNPFELWLMVVLIATLSFAGYVAIRLIGAQRGLLMTGILGGLVSSTAITLSFSRLSRTQEGLESHLASGILFACAIMFVRILIVVGVLNVPLALTLLPTLGGMGLACIAAAVSFGRNSPPPGLRQETKISNPLELQPILWFGVLLAAIVLFSRALQAWLGDAGVYLLAAIAGLTDVDAISLTLARWVPGVISPQSAALGVLIAASVNTSVKAGISAVIGTRALARRTLPALTAVLCLGGLVYLMQ